MSYTANTVEPTLFVRMEWIRNMIRTLDSGGNCLGVNVVESTPFVRME